MPASTVSSHSVCRTAMRSPSARSIVDGLTDRSRRGPGVACALTLAAMLLGAATASAADRGAALIAAAKRSDAAAVRTLLAEGAPVDAAEGDGATALLWAS